MAERHIKMNAADLYDAVREIIMLEDEDNEDRWNTKFEDKPTLKQADEWMTEHWVAKNERAKTRRAERQNAMMKKIAPELVKGMLITMSIDQQIPRIEINKLYCEKIITELVKISLFKEYEYLTGRAVRFEFWTEGKDGKPHWNPHLHINVETIKTKGKIGQPLYRKFVKDTDGKDRKWNIYSVDAEPRDAKTLENYVDNGEKAENKMDYVAMDNEYKRQNDIEEVYIIE
jgi:hypothetical protein